MLYTTNGYFLDSGMNKERNEKSTTPLNDLQYLVAVKDHSRCEHIWQPIRDLKVSKAIKIISYVDLERYTMNVQYARCSYVLSIID